MDIYNMNKLTHFRFWCQKVLPLVYDNSLSYYEVLCKVVTYINNLITDTNDIIDNVNELKNELNVVEKWIADFNTDYAEEIIRESIATMIFVWLSDSGYIMYTIPKGWESIIFNTTGMDITLPLQPEYGHLVLSY